MRVRMSLGTKRIHGKDYLYLEAGRSKTLLLGPAGSSNPNDYKIDNVKQGLEYVFGRISNYEDIYLRLLLLLPENERTQYIKKLQESAQAKPEEERRRPQKPSLRDLLEFLQGKTNELESEIYLREELYGMLLESGKVRQYYLQINYPKDIWEDESVSQPSIEAFHASLKKAIRRGVRAWILYITNEGESPSASEQIDRRIMEENNIGALVSSIHQERTSVSSLLAPYGDRLPGVIIDNGELVSFITGKKETLCWNPTEEDKNIAITTRNGCQRLIYDTSSMSGLRMENSVIQVSYR